MTEQNPVQCGRTTVHTPHHADEGWCVGLQPPPPRPLDPTYEGRRRADGVDPLRPFRLLVETWESMASRPGGIYETCARDLRAVLAGMEDPRIGEPSVPLMEALAAGEGDPLRAWMLSYPGENTTGPGWGDEDDVEAGRCCPVCRSSLTEHNRAVHEAGSAMGQRHALDALQRATTDPVKPLSRGGFLVSQGPTPDPWAFPVPYDVLVAGLRAIASTATARDDFAGAAYAYSVLAGTPLPPVEDDERRCRVCACTEDDACDPPCSWVEDDLCSACLPKPALCEARPTGPGMRVLTGCDLPPDHAGDHHAAWDAGYGWTTVTWGRS